MLLHYLFAPKATGFPTFCLLLSARTPLNEMCMKKKSASFYGQTQELQSKSFKERIVHFFFFVFSSLWQRESTSLNRHSLCVCVSIAHRVWDGVWIWPPYFSLSLSRSFLVYCCLTALRYLGVVVVVVVYLSRLLLLLPMTAKLSSLNEALLLSTMSSATAKMVLLLSSPGVDVAVAGLLLSAGKSRSTLRCLDDDDDSFEASFNLR